MKDKYDLAVEYLTAHPSEIVSAWMFYTTHTYGYLFRPITPANYCPPGCGCLTQVRRYDWKDAFGRDNNPDAKLTSLIRADKRLPEYGSNVRSEHLPVFAEWQRRIDKYYKTGILDLEREQPAPTPEPIYRFIKRHESIDALLENGHLKEKYIQS